jgi:RNA polymerase sigma factor (sigma-70 family)
MIALMSADEPVGRFVAAPATDGDAVIAAVYRRHAAALMGLARLLLDAPGQAEEVVQEAFIRTYAGWARVRSRNDPLPYVRRAVVNLARSGLRRRVRERTRQLEAVAEVPSAETTAGVHARDREVAAAVAALPRRQRECVVLRFYLDSSVKDIASMLRISEGSVKQHLSAVARRP